MQILDDEGGSDEVGGEVVEEGFGEDELWDG
jgi:hypothetical protein